MTCYFLVYFVDVLGLICWSSVYTCRHAASVIAVLLNNELDHRARRDMKVLACWVR